MVISAEIQKMGIYDRNPDTTGIKNAIHHPKQTIRPQNKLGTFFYGILYAGSEST